MISRLLAQITHEGVHDDISLVIGVFAFVNIIVAANLRMRMNDGSPDIGTNLDLFPCCDKSGRGLGLHRCCMEYKAKCWLKNVPDACDGFALCRSSFAPVHGLYQRVESAVSKMPV